MEDKECVCVCTPDFKEHVAGLAQLQQVAVLAKFGDESEITEEQPVGFFLILLLFDLKDKTFVFSRARSASKRFDSRAAGAHLQTHNG